jgi:hypothetical protein
MAYELNSDGKPIKFLLIMDNGDQILLGGDHILSKLNKCNYKQVFVTGRMSSNAQFPTLLVKEINAIDRREEYAFA